MGVIRTTLGKTSQELDSASQVSLLWVAALRLPWP